MVNALVYSYAKMVEHGFCNIDQIPEEYREAVRTYMSGGVNTQPETEIAESTSKTSINGALSLPKIEDVKINTSTAVEVDFKNENIFTPEVLEDNAFPIDISYEIERVENVYGKFEDDLSVELLKLIGGFSLKITGTPKNVKTDDTVLRVDMRIKSFNYEDMRITIYFTAQ